MARILVIDDDAAVRSVVTVLLSKKGHRVETASNGRHGLKALSDGEFDLLIVDIFMPEMDGLETIRLLRAQRSDLPVIVISGSDVATPDFLSMATKLGAVKSVRKPFRSSQLAEVVDQCLASAGKSDKST